MGWQKRVWTGVRNPPPGFAVPSLEPPTRKVPETDFGGEGWLEVRGGQFESDARPVEPELGVVRLGRWKEPDKVEPGAHVRVRGRKGLWQVRSLDGGRVNLWNAAGPLSVPAASAMPSGVRCPVYGNQRFAAVTPGNPERLGMLGQLAWDGGRVWKAAGEGAWDTLQCTGEIGIWEQCVPTPAARLKELSRVIPWRTCYGTAFVP